jgi:putative zinc finger/helix-turn-helix YgiT family protein
MADQEAAMSTHTDACFNCGAKMRTRRENVPFLGLPGVVLVGVPVSRCGGCGEHEVTIPNIDELHRVLALRVIEESGRLTSREIKFLRTVLDYTSAEFARLVGASPVTVSRWEHDVQPIGHHADALVRALVLLRMAAGLGREQIEKLARAAAPARRARGGRPIAMRSAANKWKPIELRAA